MLTWFRNQTLVFRLMILTLLVSLTITVINTVAHQWFFAIKYRSDVTEYVENFVETQTPELIQALETNDQDKVSTILATITKIDVIKAARIESINDNKNNVQKSNSKNQLLFNLDSSSKPKKLVVSTNDIYANPGFRELVVFETIASLFEILILGMGIFYLAQMLIFRHLRNIAEFSEHLSVNNLGKTLRLQRSKRRETSDELDLVVDALETMRLQLIEDLDNRRAMEISLLREKEENQEAKKLIEDTKASDQAKSKFIATMSHEIRTPMNGIIGMVQMLQGTEISDEQKNYLNIISRSSNALMHIINDILDFSKIESGKLTLENQNLSLNQHISDCVQLYIGVANTRDIRLIGNIEHGTPSEIFADSKRLLQVLSNLIGNAFKFTETGSVSINVKTLERDNETCLLHFSVKDTGIGVAEKDQESIFHAYRQADDSMTRKYGGTGLGLSICKHIVELMGGKIGLNSTPNVGSEFWFTVKFTINKDSKEKHPDISVLSNKSILYVDTHIETANLLKEHATRENIDFEHVENVSDARKAIMTRAEQFQYCVINENLPSDVLHDFISSCSQHSKIITYLLSSGNHFKQLSRDNSLKPFVLMRPLFIHQILTLICDKKSDKAIESDEPRPPFTPYRSKELEALVAEDNPVNRVVIGGLLKKLNINAHFALNGEEAVKNFCSKQQEFDLVFMDCEMPIMDGFVATTKIREWETNAEIKPKPIIALTAHVESSYQQRCFESGMDLYLSKPVTIEKIDEAIRGLEFT